MSSLDEICLVVLKKINKSHQCIFAISLLSALEKWQGLSFEQTWIPITHGCIVWRLVEIGPVALEKTKMWKVYKNDDYDEDGQHNNFNKKSLLEPMA